MEWSKIQSEYKRVKGMPCKPARLQKYKAGHIFDENMSVKWNREKVEEENKKYQDEVARLNTAKIKSFSDANELIYQKIQNDVGHGLSRESAKKIFEYVYERAFERNRRCI